MKVEGLRRERVIVIVQVGGFFFYVESVLP